MKRFIFLLCWFIPYWVNADSLPQWEVIPTESNLTFTATQNNAPVTGEFKKFTAEIFVDPNNYTTSRIRIVVDMNSLSASLADVTTTLAAPEWFNMTLFPTAEFKATEFEKTGPDSYKANGTLTIRDKTAPVTLVFTAKEMAKNKGLVEGSSTIKRSTFGVGQGEWASTEEIKDEVVVHFKIAATRK